MSVYVEAYQGEGFAIAQFEGAPSIAGYVRHVDWLSWAKKREVRIALEGLTHPLAGSTRMDVFCQRMASLGEDVFCRDSEDENWVRFAPDAYLDNEDMLRVEARLVSEPASLRSIRLIKEEIAKVGSKDPVKTQELQESLEIASRGFQMDESLRQSSIGSLWPRDPMIIMPSPPDFTGSRFITEAMNFRVDQDTHWEELMVPEITDILIASYADKQHASARITGGRPSGFLANYAKENPKTCTMSGELLVVLNAREDRLRLDALEKAAEAQASHNVFYRLDPEKPAWALKLCYY